MTHSADVIRVPMGPGVPAPEPFLGKRWLPLSAVPAEDLDRVLRAHPQPITGYTRAALTGWNAVFDYRVNLTAAGALLVSFRSPEDGQRHLLQPLGPFPEDLQLRLLQQGAQLGRPLRMVGVTSAFLEQHPEFARHWDVEDDRGSANYVYLAEDLAELPGRKYVKKRNLISQAERDYTWTVEPFTADAAQECLAFVTAINAEDGVQPVGTRAQEQAALEASLLAQRELGQRGVLLRVGGELAAFSVYEELTPDTVVVHFEKARRRHKGIYQVVNQETARRVVKEGYHFINREEDLGNEGLRQAKMTYFPLELRPSLALTLHG